MSRIFELEDQRDQLKDKVKKLKAKLTLANHRIKELERENARLKARLELEQTKAKASSVTTTTKSPYTVTWNSATANPVADILAAKEHMETPTYYIAGSDSVMYNVSSA